MIARTHFLSAVFVGMMLVPASPAASAAEKKAASGAIEMRVFKVDKLAFYAALQRFDRTGLTNLVASNTNAIKDWNSLQRFNAGVYGLFKALGLDLTAPERAIAFNEKESALFVKATRPELDVVERTLQMLSKVPPQVHVHSRLVKVPEDQMKSLLKTGKVLDAQAKGTVEILTAAKMAILQRELVDRAEILSEPDVITANGRPAQVGAGNALLNLNATLADDLFTFTLRVAIMRPEVLSAQANLWDGQTLMIVSPDSVAKKRLVIFVTPTVTDPAGNRFHSEGETQALQKRIKKEVPPQD